MRQKKYWSTVSGILVVLAIAIVLPTGAVAASKYKTLYKFKALRGHGPSAALLLDADGNLYGAANKCGDNLCGVVFKLAPKSEGSWTESVLHNFNNGEAIAPFSSLIFDPAGNLYGTDQQGAGGVGTVFKLTRNPDGSWTESNLYNFYTSFASGRIPVAGLIFDAAGNLYGTTAQGGSEKCGTFVDPGCGVVFELTPQLDGTWAESVLHTFEPGANGHDPTAGLIFDVDGNLYGTASEGGVTQCPGGCGVIFKLTPKSDGSWTKSLLHAFTGGTDGGNPLAGLVFDAAGSLYGTTSRRGGHGLGTVFKLTPNPDGSWTETVLHSFAGGRDGARPYAGLVIDAAGNLYGTTSVGGYADAGVVFKLAPGSGGSWTYSELHVFVGEPGQYPYGGLVLDQAGNLYGTTQACGNDQGCQGVVFEITP